MDIPATLVLIIVGAALAAWMTNPRTGQALDAWASGFIGYRSYGWPRGVQEEDEVHFNFSTHRDADGQVPDSPESAADVEVIELARPAEGVTVRRLR